MLRIVIVVGVIAILAALCFAQDSVPPEKIPPAYRTAFGDAPVKITLADGTRALRVTRLVGAPIEDVWKTWTTSEGLGAALGRPVTIERRIGGKFEIQWVPESPEGQRGSEGCTVQTWVPESMVAFTWNAPPSFGPLRDEHSMVVVDFDEVCDGVVRVRLTHHGFGEGEGWDGIYDYFAAAWPSVMDTVCESTGGALTQGKAGRQGWVYLFVEFSRPDLITTLTEAERATLGEHFAYLKSKTDAGELIFAGPCTDMIGPGIVIFYAESEDAARTFMEGDPAVREGIFKAELHPLSLSLLRERDRPAP